MRRITRSVLFASAAAFSIATAASAQDVPNQAAAMEVRTRFVTDLDTLLARFLGTRKLFGGDHTIIETSLIMSGDLHEHLGQLIAYARMNGIKPPWSK